MECSLTAYAKINLGLDVIRRLPNGYHELKMVMQTIGIADILKLERIPEDDIKISCNVDFVPVNQDNLIYKACKLLKNQYNIMDGVSIYLEKNIPVAAGMAGGSTDCAAALVGMNRLFELGLSMEKLAEYGVKLGADVPYCIMGGTALSEGIGEILTKLPPMPDCFILVAKPPVDVSTKMVYEALCVDALICHPDIDGMVSALEAGALCEITDRMENVLETVTIAKYPEINEIKRLMLASGAMNALMSGSGPTVFGIYQERALAEHAARMIEEQKLAKQIFVTKPVNFVE